MFVENSKHLTDVEVEKRDIQKEYSKYLLQSPIAIYCSGLYFPYKNRLLGCNKLFSQPYVPSFFINLQIELSKSHINKHK